MTPKKASIAIAVFAAICLPSLPRPVLAQEVRLKSDVLLHIRHDVSPPLRDMVPVLPGHVEEYEVEPVPLPTEPAPAAPGVPDPVVQTSPGQLLGTLDVTNFEGLGEGAYGYHATVAPPDTNGAVGATQFMQWVNASFAVFDKTTTDLLYGPFRGVTLFTGFGAPCETRNGGDGVIVYDKAADRWIFSQINAAKTVCIAVSTSSDATDTYFRYAFILTNLPAQATLSDYPKFGVWPDGYYYTANIFAGGFIGLNLCAFDRNNMLAGNDATAQCFFTNALGGSYLPADLDGSTPPPDGSPNFLVDLNGNSALRLLKFHVDWDNPDLSTLTGPVAIPVESFTRPSGGVPQFGTTNRLDTLGDRLMFRLAYRNFGDHESLVLNHSVNAGGGILGVRWYEVQDPNGTPFAYQQGTFMPDATSRWMGSIAMDQSGDIAVGYSASSSDIHPAIRYTGRTPDDPLGTLEDENSIIEGTGSQGATLHRWGDYSSITIDPVDDCTFWYTTEYHQADGNFNWNTRIASFQFPNCGATLPGSIRGPSQNAAAATR